MADSALLESFARRDPERFAQLLVAAEEPEVLAVLDALPAARAARVIARLPAAELQGLVDGHFDSTVARLSAARFDDAVILLGKLPRPVGRVLTDAVTNPELRHRLLRFLSYPEHCVGALVRTLPLQFAAELSVERLLSALRGAGGEAPPPAVVVDRDGRLLGSVDSWRLLLAADGRLASAADAARQVPTLRPEISLASAAELPFWQEHDWLPVVDGEGRVLGCALRADVLGTGTSRQSAADPVLSGVLDVGMELFRVSGDLLTRVLAGRAP